MGIYCPSPAASPPLQESRDLAQLGRGSEESSCRIIPALLTVAVLLLAPAPGPRQRVFPRSDVALEQPQSAPRGKGTGRLRQHRVPLPHEHWKGFRRLSLAPREIYVTAKKPSERFRWHRRAAEEAAGAVPRCLVWCNGWPCALGTLASWGRGHQPPLGDLYMAKASTGLPWLCHPEARQGGLQFVPHPRGVEPALVGPARVGEGRNGEVFVQQHLLLSRTGTGDTGPSLCGASALPQTPKAPRTQQSPGTIYCSEGAQPPRATSRAEPCPGLGQGATRRVKGREAAPGGGRQESTWWDGGDGDALSPSQVVLYKITTRGTSRSKGHGVAGGRSPGRCRLVSH